MKNVFVCFSNSGIKDVILNWKNKAPFTYKYTTSDELYGEGNSLEHQIIIVTVPLPTFTQTLTYNIDGILTCHENLQVALPTLVLEASDVTDDNFLVKKNNLITGDAESLMALIATSEETKLFVHFLRHSNKTVEQMLEIHCYFRQIESKHENLFYLGEVSDYFDGVIVGNPKGKNYINVYSRLVLKFSKRTCKR